MPATTLTHPGNVEGACACHPEPAPTKRISRRSVLKGGGALATVAVAVPGFGSAAFASNNSNRSGDIIVNVFLRGGMDGLSVVVPRTEAMPAQTSSLRLGPTSTSTRPPCCPSQPTSVSIRRWRR